MIASMVINIAIKGRSFRTPTTLKEDEAPDDSAFVPLDEESFFKS